MSPVNSDTSSDASSDIVADAGSSASAYVARPILAALNDLILEPVANEENWHDVNDPDFLLRTVVEGQYRFNNGYEGEPRWYKKPDSDTGSMAVTSYSRSTLLGSSRQSAHAPSLVSLSTLSSKPSLGNRTDSFLQQNVLEEDEYGNLEIPLESRQGRLACDFGFLDCVETFNDVGEWDMHCQSHFRGELPESVRCPFECEWSTTAKSGREAWDQRSIHVGSQHCPLGAVVAGRRPDQSLLRHLWRTRIINDAQFKELRKTGRLTETGQIHLRSANSRRDRRRDR